MNRGRTLSWRSGRATFCILETVMGTAIGIFSDTAGDLKAFDAALKLLAKKGARRFLFAGGKYEDLDEWVKWKRDQAREQTDYSDMDFLTDLTNYLADGDQL